jgi:hypothetical protein
MSTTPEAIRDAILRATAIVGLGGVALIHLLDAPATFQATPYKGWLYVGLIFGCVATAMTLAARSDTRAWTAATLFPLGAIAAFVVSRTVGLPQSADDIGNWSEPLGLASLFVEGSVVALGAAVLLERARLAVPRSIRASPRRRTHETLTGSSRVS